MKLIKILYLLLSNLNIFILAEFSTYDYSSYSSTSDNSYFISNSYTLTDYKESSSSKTINSSSVGVPPDKPGSDKEEQEQSGTFPDSSGSEQGELEQSGTVLDIPDSAQGELEQSGTFSDMSGSDQVEAEESESTKDKPGSDQGEFEPSETFPDISDSDQSKSEESGITQDNSEETDINNEFKNNTTNIFTSIIISSTIAYSDDSNTEETDSSNIIEISETIINTAQTNNISNLNQASVVLLGYSHFKQNNTSFSFFIYFVSIINSIISKKLKFPINIQYNTALRHLEIKDINCILQDSDSKIKLQYKCETETDNSNIKQISIEPKFDFDGQNVNLIGITSLADEYMNKIQIVDELNYLRDSMIYILDHSIYNKDNNNNLFNISGEMSEQITFEKNDLILKIKSTSSEGNKERNVNCTISNIKGKNYTLICNPVEAIKSKDLQSAYSRLENNNILLVNFDLENDINIDTVKEIDDITEGNSNKSSKGLNAGAIIGIILASIVAIGAIVAIIIILNKGNKQKPLIKVEEMPNHEYNSEESN